MSLNNFHRFLGLCVCLIMLSISLTGVMLVWKKEYLWITIPQARQAMDTSTERVAAAITTIESHYPPGSVKFVQVQSEGLALYKVYLPDKQYAWHDQSGQFIEQWGSNERFEDWLLDLHHRFLLGNTIGLNIAGFGGLIVLPLLIVGFILWWPRRRLLKLGVIPDKLQRGVLLRSHANIGALAALPIFITALTGVILVYPSEARTLLLGNPAIASNNSPVNTLSAEPELRVQTWLQMLTYVDQQYPQSTIRWVSPDTDNAPQHTIGLQQAEDWNRMGQTSLSFKSGHLSASNNGREKPAAERLFSFSYPLHVGKLGLWYRLLLSLFGLALAALSVLGLISFLRRNK